MEVSIVDYSKERITFKIKGEGHTFCNLLRKELWNDKSTSIAGYRMEHGLESVPIFVLETEDKDPKKVILDSISRLQKSIKDARAKLTKAAR